MTIKVSVVKCRSYKQKEISSSVNKALSQINFRIAPGSKILIKPNLIGANKPEQHSVTHYTIVDSLCSYFKSKKCSITIGESSAFYQRGYTHLSYKKSKIESVAKKYNAKIIAFEDEKISKAKKKLRFLKDLYLPEVIDKFDLIVNVPKIKTHMLMRYSGALKNLYGIVPGGYKQLLHCYTKNINDMADILLDVHDSIKPKILSVMDAVIGLDGGPAAVIGKPKKVGYIAASEDPIAIDTVACRMIGYKISDIPTITRAIARKKIKISNIRQIGSFVPVKFKKLLTGEIKNSKKPSVFVTETHTLPCINRKCNACKICIDYCPVKAISMKKNKAVINIKKCIFCYSCIPKCPVNAIYHKTTFKNKLIRLLRWIIGA